MRQPMGNPLLLQTGVLVAIAFVGGCAVLGESPVPATRTLMQVEEFKILTLGTQRIVDYDARIGNHYFLLESSGFAEVIQCAPSGRCENRFFVALPDSEARPTGIAADGDGLLALLFVRKNGGTVVVIDEAGIRREEYAVSGVHSSPTPLKTIGFSGSNPVILTGTNSVMDVRTGQPVGFATPPADFATGLIAVGNEILLVDGVGSRFSLARLGGGTWHQLVAPEIQGQSRRPPSSPNVEIAIANAVGCETGFFVRVMPFAYHTGVPILRFDMTGRLLERIRCPLPPRQSRNERPFSPRFTAVDCGTGVIYLVDPFSSIVRGYALSG
ncbi:MAG: hypothetical protein IPM24_07810 [Bryobacterales bacterium]|nr:hypothetical protein [Bryobacterales bacterium]